MITVQRTILALGAMLALGIGASAAEKDEPVCTVVRLDDGREVRGIVLEENERELLLRTWTGDKRIMRSLITDYRRNLSLEERASILRGADPWKDSAEWKARDAEFAGGAKKVDTPSVERIPPRGGTPNPAVARHASPAPASAPSADIGASGRAGSDLLGRLDKRVSLELVDDKLEDALDMIGVMTGINIILHPKVREAQQKVSLNVSNMDAANVLKWLTRLTDTHIQVDDQAIFITDKPDEGEDDRERNEILMTLAANGVDLTVMPPGGQPLTDAERMQIAMAIHEKTNPKPTDFPGPEMGLVGAEENGGFAANPFMVPGR